VISLYISSNFSTASLSFVTRTSIPYITITKRLFSWCAFCNSSGIVNSSYRSVREFLEYELRASIISCAVLSILFFSFSEASGQGKLLYTTFYEYLYLIPTFPALLSSMPCEHLKLKFQNNKGLL